MVPLERYRLDAITRDIRRARHLNAEGFAKGDIYVGTYIQLIENQKWFPNVLLTLNFKTASGSNLTDARHTDTPGYFFDLSFGKELNVNHQKTKRIMTYAMLGMYVWQLHGNRNQQNDALLYGFGLDLISPKFEIRNVLGGYYGYLGNGDRPMVYRLICSTRFPSKVNYDLRIQSGLHDFGYTSFRLSARLNLSNPKLQ